MIEIEYAPSFLRQFKKLPVALQAEAYEKIQIFKTRDNHKQLEVHKLGGKMNGKLSFSVNYKYRIVFMWLPDGAAGLLAIGDHNIYK
jgi:plasmid maintenance system killer protein